MVTVIVDHDTMNFPIVDTSNYKQLIYKGHMQFEVPKFLLLICRSNIFRPLKEDNLLTKDTLKCPFKLFGNFIL